eukprot:11215078-Alexandrium_andersonii.AAC.1
MDYEAAIALAEEAMASRDARSSAPSAPSGGVRGGASSEDEEAAAEAYHAELARPLVPPEALQTPHHD